MQTIQNIFDNMEVVTEEAYKNTELLLEQYTKVMFRIEKNIVDIDYELYVVEGKHLKECFTNWSISMQRQRNEESRISC